MADADLGSLIAKLACDITNLKQGLQDGKAQLASFQQLAEAAGKKVKEALAFAGISLGLYEIVSQLKEFTASVLEVGAKTEMLRGSAEALGSYFGVSASTIDLYVGKLKDLGIEQERAFYSINAFLKSGVSIDMLPALAEAAKNLAPSMAMSFNEAFSNIIQGIVKGTPKQLAELVPGIKQALQAATTETKQVMDEMVVSGPERAQIMLNYVLQAAQAAKGVGAEVADSYLMKMEEYRRKVLEVKEALFEFVKPVALAITNEEIRTWEDLYAAIGNNKQALAELGEAVAVWVGDAAEFIRIVASLVAQHKELAKVLLEVYGVVKVLTFLSIAEGAAAASVAVRGLIGRLAALRLALAGPWALVIAVSIVGLTEGLKGISSTVKKTPSVGTSMLMGEAEFAQSDEDRAAQVATGQVADAAAAEQRRLKASESMTHEPVPQSEAAAKAQADTAAKLGRALSQLPGGGGKGGGGGGKETADNLLAPYLAMLKAKRDADLEDSKKSLDLLKATDDLKRSELQRALAAQEIDGRTYYQKLQDLNQAETTQAIALIDKKRRAQETAYQEQLEQLNQDPKLSDEAKDIARQKLAADNRKAMIAIDEEAAKTRLDGEKKVTEELTRQVDLRRTDQQKIEDLNLDTAQLLGAITEQEAKLQRLTLDWQRTKQDAIKAGSSPELIQALQTHYQAQTYDVQYGQTFKSIGGEITSGLSNIITGIRSGSLDIIKTLDDMFNNIMMTALKPGFDALGTALSNVINSLLNSIMGSMGGGWGLFGYEGSAHGNVFHQGVQMAFAGGGILTRPTLFPMAGGMGLAGEAGYEGILPLQRVNGDLGVKAALPGPPTVNIINQTGVEAQGSAQMKDDGSLDVILERKTLSYVTRGPVNNMIRALIKGS